MQLLKSQQHVCVFVSLRDNLLWLHSVFALVYFIITLLCMAHHSARLEYREDERVCPHTLSSGVLAANVKFPGMLTCVEGWCKC